MTAYRWVPLFLAVATLLVPTTRPAADEGTKAAKTPAYAAGWSDRQAKRDPKTLTVPYRPVTREDYIKLVRPYAAGFEHGPDRGQYGPRHALPALAVFARTGDRALGEGIKKTLRHYGRWVDAEIAREKGVFSLEGATLLAIHFRELRRKGLVTPGDEQWLKQTLLRLRQYEAAWQPGDGLWRGSHHRSVAQGTNHLLAATLYPDEPEAAKWKAYGETVWNDWWQFRDIGINDTSYFYSSLSNILRTADLLNRREMFTDAKARATVWDRLVHETTPDGVLIPYGSHTGWHGLAGVRIWALELAARATRDGRYRYAASRLMNFGQARGFSPTHHHWNAMSIEAIALAALACDDSVKPVRPDGGSRVLSRPEIVRLFAEQVRQRFPDAGGVDCEMYMTDRTMPHKLVLRSGWNPGDLFMLVECYPRHDPLNPTAIVALERFSSSFAEMTSEKFISRENAVRIDDLSGKARFVGTAGQRGGWPKELPLGYDRMESSVEAFSDHALATHARLKVTNYMGFHAVQTRELLFVKNRFVLMRDETAFDDTFRARAGPVWNTQNVGDKRGQNWVDTWFTAHWYQGHRLYENAPYDLLLYYAPREGASLTVTDPPSQTTLAEPQGSALGRLKVTQYAWEGDVRPGDRVQFVSLLLPHAPSVDAASLAGKIRVIRDEPGVAAVAVSPAPGRWEMALLNRTGKRLTVTGPRGSVTTDACALYLDLDGSKPARYMARAATLLQVGDMVLRKAKERGDADAGSRRQ